MRLLLLPGQLLSQSVMDLLPFSTLAMKIQVQILLSVCTPKIEDDMHKRHLFLLFFVWL